MIFVVLLVGLTVLLAFGKNELKLPFFSDKYVFSSVNGIGSGPNGTILAVDNGNTTLAEVNSEGKLDGKINGGSMNVAFYYATHACQDNRGNIYVCDIIYGEHGNRLDAERIIRINGSEREEIKVIDYSQADNPPLQYGKILELRIFEGKPYYVYDNGISIDVFMRHGSNWEKLHSFYYPPNIRVNAASYDADTGMLIFAGKNGHLYTYQGTEFVSIELPDFAEGQIPMAVTTSNGKAYIADVVDGSIYVWEEGNSTIAPELFSVCDTTAFRLSVSQDGEKLIFSDQQFFYTMSLDDPSETQTFESTAYSRWSWILLLRVCLVIWAILVICLLALVVKKVCRSVSEGPNRKDFGRMVMVAIPALLVSAFVAYSVISVTIADKKEKQIRELQMFSKILASQVDMDSLALIQETEDDGSQAFRNVKEPLDKIIDQAYEIEDYYYYILLRPNEPAGYLELLLDYEDGYPCRMPAYTWEDNEYVQAVTTGEDVLVEGGISSFGSWTYTLVPIRDDSGEVAALLEVGMNFKQLKEMLNRSVREICLGASAGAVVVTMFVMELLFLMGYYEKKQVNDRTIEGITLPLRFIMFIVYMTDCMQDAFIAIMCAELYQAQPGEWFHSLPESIAIALPMSAQLFAAAAASLFGGSIAQRRGAKTVMVFGFTLGVLGFLVCATGFGYNAVLVGKCCFGLGQGLVYVAANALSGSGANESAREHGYADVAAGVLSGVTIGVGLGSLVLSIGNYQAVYIVGASCMLVGLVMSLRSKRIVPTAAENEEGEAIAGLRDTLRFLFSRRVWSFLLLILTPFMIALSFRDYLFPLYANEANISEVRIGQIYLLFGMAVLYVGPSLARFLIDKLGAKYSVAVANATMVAAIGIFALHPSMPTILIGVGLLYIGISFAYACQYYYFEELSETKTFGVGGAFGIYSMFENIGQTLGPVIFGSVMLLGFRSGGMLIAGILLVLLMLFILISRAKEGTK